MPSCAAARATLHLQPASPPSSCTSHRSGMLQHSTVQYRSGMLQYGHGVRQGGEFHHKCNPIIRSGSTCLLLLRYAEIDVSVVLIQCPEILAEPVPEWPGQIWFCVLHSARISGSGNVIFLLVAHFMVLLYFFFEIKAFP